jgi:hypothetical protein
MEGGREGAKKGGREGGREGRRGWIRVSTFRSTGEARKKATRERE